VAVHAIAGCLT
jgi:hypothetical protein